jgi:hypothetical protein
MNASNNDYWVVLDAASLAVVDGYNEISPAEPRFFYSQGVWSLLDGSF